MSCCLAMLAVGRDRLQAGALASSDERRGCGLEPLGGVHAGLDALGQRDLLRPGEQRDLADLLEVHAHGVEAAALDAVGPRAAAWRARRRRRVGAPAGAADG